MKTTSLRSIIALTCLAAGMASAETTYNFNIQTESLSDALKEFASQSGFQVVYFAKIAANQAANPVSGSLSVEEALEKLLAPSSLTYQRLDARTIAIRDAESRSTSDTRGRSAAEMDALRKTSTLSLQDPYVRIAQLDSPASEKSGLSGGSDSADPAKLEEILVTGSNIRGVVNETVPVIVMDREYIERSGFSSVQQLLESLPQNMQSGKDGASEDGLLLTNAGNAALNESRATGANLRGLGPQATLTLIDGRRIASATTSQYIDISMIPISAVERVEVLTDGASAVYGSDAVAGVINIILRKGEDLSNAETGVAYGTVTSGGLNEWRANQSFSKVWSGGHMLLLADHYDRDQLQASERSFSRNAEPTAYLLPDRKQTNVMLNVAQELLPNLDLSANLLYFTQDVASSYALADRVSLSRSATEADQWSAFLGLGYEPFGDWRFDFGGAYSRRTPVTIAIGSGAWMSHSRSEYVADQWSVDLKGDGTLLRLPAGPAKLAIGTSFREDTLWTSSMNLLTDRYSRDERMPQKVASIFAELYVPLVAEAQNVPLAERLDISIAARHDDYSGFDGITKPRVGVVWTPFTGFDVRASYSESFRAPNVSETDFAEATSVVAIFPFFAPDGTLAPVLTHLGGRPLAPEEAESMTFGFSWRPAFSPRMTVSVNYFDIDYANRINTPPLDMRALLEPAVYRGLLTEFASEDESQAYVDGVLEQGGVFVDAVGEGLSNVRFLYDMRQRNAARLRTSGLDFAVDSTFESKGNTFNLGLNLNHLRKVEISHTRSSSSSDILDTYGNPIDWVVRGMATWSRGGLRATLIGNYRDGYRDPSGVTDVPVSSWTTIDLTLGYQVGAPSRVALFNGSRFSLSVQNALDRDPPRVHSNMFDVGYDPANADPLGRFVSLSWTKQW